MGKQRPEMLARAHWPTSGLPAPLRWARVGRRVRRARRSRHGVDDLVAQRRKLLRLYYDDKVGADLFAEEEARLSVAIREAQRESDDARVEVARSDDVAQHFDAGSAARNA